MLPQIPRLRCGLVRGCSIRARRRRGLAPLELVLALPILLAIMALIMVFGTAASWKLRTEVASRDMLWRHRWPLAGRHHAQPPAWPKSAGESIAAGEPIAPLGDPAIRRPVVSGPLPGSVRVNEQTLNYLRGSGIAEADIERRPPMFREMPSYRFRVETMLLDNKFQYCQMGLGRNRQRRMPLIYDLPEPPGDLTAAYRNAVQANETALLDPRLWPLDRDPVLREIYGYAPDFYPRLRIFTSLDREWVREHRVEPLMDRIEDLPDRMARIFGPLATNTRQRQYYLVASDAGGRL